MYTQTRRGSALLLVLIMVLVLTGLAASLFLLVRSAAVESTSIVDYGESLEFAEVAEARTVSDFVQFTPEKDGAGWKGFVDANVDPDLKDTRIVKKKLEGREYSVYVRSAYLAGKHNTTKAGFLVPVSEADRNDFSKLLFDVYEIDAVTPPVGQNGYQRGIQTVYEVRKMNIPAALYLEKPQVPAWNGTQFVVDGADHTLKAKVPGSPTSIKMPFSGKMELAYGGSNAGIHSAFQMTDPETGEIKEIFYDSKNPYNDWVGGSKNPLIVPAGAELDFWIHARAEAWSKGMGEYDHHAFGQQYFDPTSPFDKKAFGATWQRIQLKTSTSGAKLLPEFQQDYPDLAAQYPKMNMDPDKDGYIGENSEGLGTSTNWSKNSEDFTGDGKVEFEKDIDGNGKLNTWFGNQRNEDLNKDGKVQDADYQLSKIMQEWIETKHPELIDHVELRLGFEDLPGWYGSNDWDYDDLVMTLNLVPSGNLVKDSPPVILDTGYDRSAGIPGLGSTMDFTDLGLNSKQKQEQEIRSMLTDSKGVTKDVLGINAYTQQPLDIREFASNFIGGNADKLVPNADVTVINDTLKKDTPLGSKDNIQLTYVSGDGGTIAGQVEGGGVLVVEGDLHISGQFTFYGTVIVLGNLTMSGGGAGIHVFGNVMVGGDFAISGNSNIWYSSESINKVYETFKPRMGLYAVQLSWRELSNAEVKAVQLR